MYWNRVIVLLVALPAISALRWHPDHVGYNLNENETANHPRDYWGEWDNHTYHPSPKNWRIPFYAVTIDRYLDGDPTNNEANGTVFEHHWLTNQFRFGGDTKGLQNDLDYIQGLGVKAFYMVGSPFLNRPWSGDGFGPLDFTLLDRHHGAIEDWRNLITEIHRRGMYVVFDNTMATMGDLIAFDEYVNATTPFNFREYDYLWKTGTRYHDFQPGNDWNASCRWPRIWGQDGFPLTQDILDQMYGDIKGTGAYPSYINSMSKFASVQDRLREWRPDVLEKIKIMSCMQIAMFDIDGFRMDKALQTTVDAMAEFADFQRQCARRHGKENFLVVGEVVGDPNLASVYNGRGKQPDQALANIEDSVFSSNETDPASFIRPFGMSALDGAAFHYDIYGAMTRFLGLDSPWGARGVDWVDQWNFMLTHNDMVNANTGEFDPRHMFGMTNHDVFRWPALANGTQRQLLGLFVTMLELPGVPLLLWGEEQEFYVLENLANDYVFGREPMGSSSAWQLHGCYGLGETVYVDMPFNSSGYGCHDDSVSLDHRDPAKPMRNVLKRMFELRQQYPVLNDGYNLTTLSKKIYEIYLPGSGGIPSPHGLWSVYRGRSESVQDFTGIGQENQGIWMLYSNEKKSRTYEFDCSSPNTSLALISAFPADTTIKNLFYPYEEYTLESSVIKYGIEGSTEFNGCLPRLETVAWDYKAFVPKDKWVTPGPTITKTVPSHDARLNSTVAYEEQESVPIQIRFSSEMNCDSVTDSIEVDSTTQGGQQARLDRRSVNCTLANADPPRYVGEIPTAWIFSANVENVYNGVHTVTVRNASTEDGKLSTNTVDRFMFRIGQSDNPMVFTKLANYTTTLLHRGPKPGQLYISPRAAGADKIRYSRNWGSSFSKWIDYTGENITLESHAWSGTEEQEWEGEHVIVHYWSQKSGSSDHVQHADLERDGLPPRRFPHVFVQGDFNQYGYDGGLESEMQLHSDGLWSFDLVTDFPSSLVFNVWGMNPDGIPDKSQSLGDVDGDYVLDWVPPDSLARNLVNITRPPPGGYIGYRLTVNDGTYGYHFSPVGSYSIQIAVSVLLALVPIVTAVLGIWIFMTIFYKVKFNRVGIDEKSGMLAFLKPTPKPEPRKLRNNITSNFNESREVVAASSITPSAGAAIADPNKSRRTMLIATLEYEIEDWEIKIKIGGLGVISSLMAKHLSHHDIIWVVPCVGGIDYPSDAMAYPMDVTILGQKYEISVQYHMLRNITFVLLDAPIFRKQTKANPYPARMDDLESAIFYSAWNQCIALSIERFDPDLYHINDYHGAAAPLYLLPRVVPCCLSLHNAEFQGMWSLGTQGDMDEVCRVFNLDKDTIERYIQFGGVFNLLHAAASYLRIHQKGFGAVGVSGKYGKRSKQRYPIFWSLPKIGSLANPDPADTAEMDSSKRRKEAAVIDSAMEASRRELRCHAQEWAGLTIDPEAELFVFVGRWSMQKGIDIIADVFFSVLEENAKAQLICVGPVIDLYGKFAALKLEKLVARFPGRVFSKPEFTALPPCIFSGAEFALIPSRDEPFGLVAVEFGRKGALGVGSRVGGLGSMPGWWYTVESLTSAHLIHQFKQAIRSALASNQETRAKMRARAMVQRFPVQQWVEDLDKLQANSIRVNHYQQEHGSLSQSLLRAFSPPASGHSTPTLPSRVQSPVLGRSGSPVLGPVPPGRALTPVNLSLEALPRIGSDQSLHSHVLGAASLSGQEHQTSRAASRTWYRATSSGVPLSALAIPDNTFHFGDDNEVEVGPLWGSRRTSPQSSRAPSPPLSRRNTSWNLLRFGASSSAPPSPPLPQPEIPTEGSVADPARKYRDRFSYNAIVDQKKDFELQKVDVTFTDSQNEFYNNFSRKLDKLDASSSEGRLCIEEFLTKSEKAWFGRFHRAKLGMDPETARPTTLPGLVKWLKVKCKRVGKGAERTEPAEHASEGRQSTLEAAGDTEFLLGEEYEAPSGIKRLLQKKIGDWQLYCFLLAFGQIVAANSYQITILTGEYGKAAEKLYVVAAIYIVATVIWWYLFRRVKALYVVSLPFAFYGLAFFVLGMGLYAPNMAATNWVFNVATGLYAVASASGSLYFVLNFGTEGGTPAQTWAFRACVIQGTQQIYVAFLWYWGATLNTASDNSGPPFSSKAVTAITVPIAVLMWAVGIILYLGLPNYYRRQPGNVPSFYRSLFRRKSVLWFFVMVILQNYFLSATYNRNWKFLWRLDHHPAPPPILRPRLDPPPVHPGQTLQSARVADPHLRHLAGRAALVPDALVDLRHRAVHPHPPADAAGGGAALAQPALQGIGFGMILLQTLTRFHVAAALCASQVLGSVMTIAARASAPNRVGPGPVFPNFGLVGTEGLRSAWFWAALVAQLLICAGFAKVFRKEQLFKP
ncbi:hypothetical protein EPUS_08063 [Endocarpon pusillum Z07020]|uniref:alpha-1,3-glucan synthase n=1 Tax=Endocarpon pusillum (strain Z07020 / HMAS-L-300199) TaxID=1263415 RepID=U1GA61_ENDPU|nr:uncharacterized protein EPUS_08063 [Endocarpon pusillum Z07020]ERF68903.1 hypothetical protein EPUS_08063 [Endocarpon pusillum Z07020]